MKMPSGANGGGGGSMSPYFHFNLHNEAPLWFDFLQPNNASMLIGLSVFLAVAGFFYRFLHRIDRRLQRQWASRGDQEDREWTEKRQARKTNSQGCCLAFTSKRGKVSTREEDTMENGNALLLDKQPENDRGKVKNRLSRGIWFAFVTAVGYMLMLSVMTYNPYFFLSLLIGMGIGEAVFGHMDRGEDTQSGRYMPADDDHHNHPGDRVLSPTGSTDGHRRGRCDLSPAGSTDAEPIRDISRLPIINKSANGCSAGIGNAPHSILLNSNNHRKSFDIGSIASADPHGGPTVRLVGAQRSASDSDDNKTATTAGNTAFHGTKTGTNATDLEGLISPLNLPAAACPTTFANEAPRGTSRPPTRVAFKPPRRAFHLMSSSRSTSESDDTASAATTVTEGGSGEQDLPPRVLKIRNQADNPSLTTTSEETLPECILGSTTSEETLPESILRLPFQNDISLDTSTSTTTTNHIEEEDEASIVTEAILKPQIGPKNLCQQLSSNHTYSGVQAWDYPPSLYTSPRLAQDSKRMG
ncbi:unnamed protein product [Sympodiomycopsis kandeliae]